VSPVANGVKVRLYRDNGNIFIHPDDPTVCLIFHSCNEPCPCESWEKFGEATLPVFYYIQRGEMLSVTGEVMHYRGKYWEVLALE
jgi:hypothetical protein